MGVWGAGLYENDTAEDIRVEFEELIADKVKPALAGSRLEAAYAGELDEGNRPLFYLALADLLRAHRVTDHPVIDSAMRLAREGAGLAIWRESDEGEYEKRRAVYDHFIAGHVAYTKPMAVRLKIGDNIRIPLPTGKFGYCQYILMDAVGPMIRVYDFITDSPEASIRSSKLLFPPIYVGLLHPIRAGRWVKIGNENVAPFTHPRFLSYQVGLDRKAHNWSIFDFDSNTFLARFGDTLPPEYRSLEVASVYAYDLVEQRIADGKDPHAAFKYAE